jgi:tripartite-type tricarboxylate transporter receptor subunit TctC
MASRRRFLMAFAALSLAPAAVPAQELPRQITIVVGFPAGGGTDLIARHIAEGLRGTVAPVVTVENRAGASGRVAVEHVKNAKPDGATLLYTPAFPLVISPHAYKEEIRYDTLHDFVPVGVGGRSMLALSVGPAVPAEVKTLADFVAWVKADPKRGVFGAPPGSSQHFAGQLFARSAGIKLDYIPYKGGAPAMTDLLGGHIPANVSPLSEALPHHQGGKIRILAVTATKRAAALPDVPTFVELGHKDVVFQDWNGLLAPAGTPAAIVERINAAMAKVSTSPAGQANLEKFGMAPDTPSPQEFARTVKSDYERYGEIIRALGFKPES